MRALLSYGGMNESSVQSNEQTESWILYAGCRRKKNASIEELGGVTRQIVWLSAWGQWD
jgi:hypothetical protein